MMAKNRLLKNTTQSKKVNSLSDKAEIFFYRLIMSADINGNCVADARLLRSKCFPLKDPLIYVEPLINEWLNECIETGLIVLYTVKNDSYVHIPNYGQRVRGKGDYPLLSESDENNFVPPVAAESGPNLNFNSNLNSNLNPSVELAPLVYPFNGEVFMNLWGELLKEKKWKNKTQRALQMNLNILSRSDESTAIKMIENTLSNGWQGIFEIKNGTGKTQSKQQTYDSQSLSELNRSVKSGNS